MRGVQVLIIGAGGHGQVVADILLRMADEGSGVILAGFLDDCRDLLGQVILGAPVLGRIADCKNIRHDTVIVAIGENKTRQRIFKMLQQDGDDFSIAQHPKSIVAPDVRIGAGSMICGGVVLNTAATIGGAVILNTGCTVDHHNYIGSFAHIGPGANLGGEVEIGEGSLVGIGATVMPGKRIGAWSIVGAGALVNRDVPERSVVVGVPARVIKTI